MGVSDYPLIALPMNRQSRMRIVTTARTPVAPAVRCRFRPAALLGSLLLCACVQDPGVPQASGRDTAAGFCAAVESQDRPAHWVTSWKTAPGDAILTHPISGLTVRQAFAPHFDGETLRLRLSNRYASVPVTLDQVHIARERAPGSAELVPGSSCLLRFNGQSRVTLPAGASLLSDPVAYPVRAFERLSVSFFAPGPTPQITRHLNANEVLYMSVPGDFADDPGGAAFQANPEGYSANVLAIEALEVIAAAPVSTLVAVGDSLTDGSASTTGFLDGEGSPMTATDQRYPNHLQRRILAAGLPLAVANAGIGGNELLTEGWLPQFGPALLDRLDADVLEVSGARHVLLMIGTNDLGNPQAGPTPTAQDLIDGLTEVIRRVHAAGLSIVLGTIPPAEGTVTEGLVGDVPVGVMHGTAQARQARDAVNAWIREQQFSDGIVDFAACLEDPARPGYLAPEFNSGDNLHPNPAGYAAMAQCVDLELFRAAG